MNPFHSSLGNQIKIGSAIGLCWGILLGIVLSVLLISGTDVHLILPTAISRLYIVAFLTCLVALLSSLTVLPVGIIFAGPAQRFHLFQNLNSVWFYFTYLIVSSVFIYCSLWILFNWVENAFSLKSLLILAGLALLSIMILLAINSSRRKNSISEPFRIRGVTLIAVHAVLLLITIGCYRSLTKVPELTGIIPPALSRKFTPESATNSTSAGWNVLLISIDTLRPDHLGCYNDHNSTSPTLDQIAASGAIFLNARSQAPWTLPSHATMMTSLYPSTHGARFSGQHTPILDKLDDSNVTLAEILDSFNYRTAAFTSSFWLTKPWGVLQGFQKFKMKEPTDADDVVDEGLKWIQQKPGQPFFLFLHFYDVHNYKSPASFQQKYLDPNYDGKLKNQEMLLSLGGTKNLNAEDLKFILAQYDAALNFVDHELNRFFTWLRSAGLYDKTMIVITSDHGEEFEEHQGTGHGFTLYDEVLRVPLIIRLPDRQIGVKKEELVGVIDIFPTILDFLSIPKPSFLEGMSLMPLIEGGKLNDRPLFAEDTYYLNSYSIIQKEYKYIENKVPPTELLNPQLLYVNLRCFFKFRGNELYQITKNPDEKSNLLQNEASRAAKMREQLLQHIKIQNSGEHDAMDEQMREKLHALGYIN